MYITDLVSPVIPEKNGTNIIIYVVVAFLICLIGIILFKIINKKENVKK